MEEWRLIKKNWILKFLNCSQVRKRRDEGMYQCVAYNELNTRYSSSQLRVLAFAPTFAKYPLEEKTFAAEGGNVTLKSGRAPGNIRGGGGRTGDLTILWDPLPLESRRASTWLTGTQNILNRFSIIFKPKTHNRKE